MSMQDPELVVIDMTDQGTWAKAEKLLNDYEREAAALTGQARSKRRHAFLVTLIATMADTGH